MFKLESDDHDAPKEPEGTTSSSTKVGSHRKKEGEGTDQQEYNERWSSENDTEASQTSLMPLSTSSNSSLPSNPQDSAAETECEDVFSQKSFAASVKRSFEALENVDLSSRTGWETGSFFPVSGIYSQEWSWEQERSRGETDALDDLVAL